jgi:hypothetical protein
VNVDGENSPRRQDTHHGGHVILWDPFNIIWNWKFSSDGHVPSAESADSISRRVRVGGLESVTTTRSQILPSFVLPSAGATAARAALHQLLLTVRHLNFVSMNLFFFSLDFKKLPEVDGIPAALLAFTKFNYCGCSVSPATTTSALVSHRWHARIISVVNLRYDVKWISNWIKIVCPLITYSCSRLWDGRTASQIQSWTDR